MNDYDYILKVITIGNSGVGKSAIVNKFVHNIFNESHDITIGVEFATKIINTDDKKLKIQLWDTAGQECFRSIARQYYRDSAGIILVYDITNRKSFDDLQIWIDEIRKITIDNPVIVLVGNKCDLDIKRVVSSGEGIELAKNNNFLFTEISVKSNLGIKFIFNNIAEIVLNKIKNGEIISGVKKHEKYNELKTEISNKKCC